MAFGSTTVVSWASSSLLAPVRSVPTVRPSPKTWQLAHRRRTRRRLGRRSRESEPIFREETLPAVPRISPGVAAGPASPPTSRAGGRTGQVPRANICRADSEISAGQCRRTRHHQSWCAYRSDGKDLMAAFFCAGFRRRKRQQPLGNAFIRICRQRGIALHARAASVVTAPGAAETPCRLRQRYRREPLAALARQRAVLNKGIRAR